MRNFDLRKCLGYNDREEKEIGPRISNEPKRDLDAEGRVN